VPLLEDEDLQYMLALKQEFFGNMKKSKYYLRLDDKKKDIERYTDKYKLTQLDSSEIFSPGMFRVTS